MQNPYTYTKHFLKPTKVNSSEVLLNYFTSSFTNLKETMDKYPFDGVLHMYIEETWFYGANYKFDHGHLKILESLAKFLGIKVMYHDTLYQDMVVKGYKFIGDLNQVMVMIVVWDYIHHILLLHGEKLAITIKSKLEASLKNFDFMIIISRFINKFLEKGYNNTLELEKYIMNHYKLKYKDYHTESKLYFHAISPKYRHNMMLL